MFWKRGWPLAPGTVGAWPPESKTALFQTLGEATWKAQDAPSSALAAAELLTALVVDFGYVATVAEVAKYLGCFGVLACVYAMPFQFMRNVE